MDENLAVEMAYTTPRLRVGEGCLLTDATDENGNVWARGTRLRSLYMTSHFEVVRIEGRTIRFCTAKTEE